MPTLGSNGGTAGAGRSGSAKLLAHATKTITNRASRNGVISTRRTLRGGPEAATARSGGITTFLFDWYWYDGPFLNRALDHGFLTADHAGLKFALLWANHDWKNIQPALSYGEPPTLLSGACSPKQFETLVDHIVELYLCHPDYLTIDGAVARRRRSGR